jgi:predicted dehydrogenase
MIKIGVIGGGKWGKNHLRALSEISCKITGLADTDESKRQIAADYKIHFTRDFRELCALSDAVVVVTPASTHFDVAAECLRLKKHVLVEKPLTMSSNQANELVEAAERQNLILATGHLYRFNPAVIKLKEEIGKIGSLRYLKFRYVNMNPEAPRECNIIFDLGSHLFDLLLFILERTPERIHSTRLQNTSHFENRFADIMLDYGNFAASLELSWRYPQKLRDGWMIGSNSSIYTDFLKQEITIYPEPTVNEVTQSAFTRDIEKVEPLKEELRQFVECIEMGKKPINNGDDSCRVIRLCEAAIESGNNGKEVFLW